MGSFSHFKALPLRFPIHFMHYCPSVFLKRFSAQVTQLLKDFPLFLFDLWEKANLNMTLKSLST